MLQQLPEIKGDAIRTYGNWYIEMSVVKTEDGWAGKARGGERVSVKGNTKAEVVARTAGIAKNYGNSQVVIHKMDGKIQSERTYGNDPFPPKG